MLSSIEIIIFGALLIFTVIGFFQPIILKYRLVRIGQPENRFDNPGKRVLYALNTVLRGFIRKERPVLGFIHIFILYGSLTFDTVSVSHILEGVYPGFHISDTHLLIADIFAVLVIFAVLAFMVRRYIMRPKSYTYTTNESLYIYLLLLSVTFTFLGYEGAMIAHDPSVGTQSFVGKIFAGFILGSELSVRIWWWIHILNVFGFVLYVPRSKYLHMFLAPVNSAFKNTGPKNSVAKLDLEDEDIEEFGVSSLKDFTWKDLLDGFACIDCGRCEDYCPAAESGKALSPKNIILKMRDSLLKDGPQFLQNKDNEEFEPPMLAEEVYSADEIWACTTCGACIEVCPVNNEQFPKIVKMRQSRVLMESDFPSDLKRVFKGLTNNQNPWGLGAGKRMEWAQDMEIPEYDENTEYLLYLGCASVFDEKSQKTARSLINILKKNNISFGILGEDEVCCGETARRLGEEAIGQELIETNIETFNELKVKKLVTACPHCFNTFKNEYPQFGLDIEVIHHSQLLADMVKQGKIKQDKEVKEKVVIHDPCYLGRANNEYDALRDGIKGIKGLQLVEHSRSKEHSHCCGAGGGRFWLEEDEGDRINHNRVKQLAETEPTVIATACPYCMRMLSDGKNDLGHEKVEVKDIAVIIEESMQ